MSLISLEDILRKLVLVRFTPLNKNNCILQLYLEAQLQLLLMVFVFHHCITFDIIAHQ